MANKQAHIVLQFDNVNYALWKPFIENADHKLVDPLSDARVVVLTVKNFILLDHQFIQLKFDVAKGNEIQVWIPRNFVKGIAEGKSDLSAAFSFAGKTSK